MKKRLYNMKEAADYLGISVPTLKSWRQSGAEKIPSVNLGSRVLYDLKELDAFIEKKKTESASNE